MGEKMRVTGTPTFFGQTGVAQGVQSEEVRLADGAR